MKTPGEEIERYQLARITDSDRLNWVLSKVGVERDNGRSYVWHPGGSTKLDSEDRLNSLRAIDAAIAAARKEK